MNHPLLQSLLEQSPDGSLQSLLERSPDGGPSSAAAAEMVEGLNRNLATEDTKLEGEVRELRQALLAKAKAGGGSEIVSKIKKIEDEMTQNEMKMK